MNQKYIGIILIIMGILLGMLTYSYKVKEDFYIENMIDMQEGSCFLEDGTCLHADRVHSSYIISGIISGLMVLFGLYLIFFDRTQQLMVQNNKEVASALKEAKKKDTFKAFLEGFTSEEKSILQAVHDQDGIKQSTLRFRTGLSKSTLSLLLKSLEERGYVSRKSAGKTNEVYLRKRF